MSYKLMKKRFSEIAPSRHRFEVFRDFVEVFALAIRNSFDRDGWQEREDIYLHTIKPYSREELNEFGKLMALVTQQMEDEPADILGRLYMELEISSDSMGQFFTPYDLAKLIAGMSIGDLVAQAKTGFATLYEPACGAGAFLVAACQALKAEGINYQQQLHVTADDLSPVSVHMAYIHLSLLHVPAVVFHRNTLTMETFGAWRTPAHHLGMWDYRLKSKPEQKPVTPQVADWDSVFSEVAA